MQQFSFYHTMKNALYKTTCSLVEKTYHNKLRAVLLTPNVEVQELLNKQIWTYSKQQFIPHGSKLDPMHEKQPIYITHEPENPNGSNVLIIIEPFNIEELFRKNYIGNFQRVIIIYEALDDLDSIIETINKLTTHQVTINCYQQNVKAMWKKTGSYDKYE